VLPTTLPVSAPVCALSPRMPPIQARLSASMVLPLGPCHSIALGRSRSGVRPHVILREHTDQSDTALLSRFLAIPAVKREWKRSQTCHWYFRIAGDAPAEPALRKSE